MWGALGKKYNNKSWTSHFINEEEEERNSLKSMIFVLKHSTMLTAKVRMTKALSVENFPTRKHQQLLHFHAGKERKILSHGGDDKLPFRVFHRKQSWKSVHRWLSSGTEGHSSDSSRIFIWEKHNKEFYILRKFLCCVVHVLHSWNFI